MLLSVETALREGNADAARKQLARAYSLTRRLQRNIPVLDGERERYQLVLARTLQVTLARGVTPMAEQILDGMMAIVQANRGFVGLTDGDDWRFLVARNLERGDIEDPAAHVSTSIIAQALTSGEPVVANDALKTPLAGAASINALQLRSVACLPLKDRERVLGFVYLDNADTAGMFDDAAVSALHTWLPVVSGSVARALEPADDSEGLPGVVTRSTAMQAKLRELARVARFDAPVLLSGETGTGKSLIAQQIHEASPRSSGPFIHVNCGAIPEALIEGELFGAEAGAYTGAQQRRVGKFEAAAGGTIFLDELDSMPLASQVRLLVVLQEKRLTRLGGHTAVPIDVRVIAAMSSAPFEAIDEGKLREDLYYRLAVFVAQLPPLRDRREDIPLLASHFLDQTRSRYRLPPLRLSEAALAALEAHHWPGNIRELANALDRAALLATDGVIESITLHARRGSAPSGAGVIEQLERASRALVVAMEKTEELRSLETAEVFKALVLLEAIRTSGGRDEGFSYLGMEKLVANRNQNRAFKREATRLKTLSVILAEPLSALLQQTIED